MEKEKDMNEIRIEADEKIIEGFLVDLAGLNKIARMKCKGLTYLMNVMDDNTTKCYMWFKDDDKNESYLVKI